MYHERQISPFYSNLRGCVGIKVYLAAFIPPVVSHLISPILGNNLTTKIKMYFRVLSRDGDSSFFVILSSLFCNNSCSFQTREFTLKMWSFAFSSPVELFCKFTCNEGLSNFRFIPTLNNITVDYTTDRKVTKQQFKFLLDKSVAASCILFICLC